MLGIAGDPEGARLERPPQYAVARATDQRTADKGRSSLTAYDRPTATGFADPTPIAARAALRGGPKEHLPRPGISLPEAHI